MTNDFYLQICYNDQTLFNRIGQHILKPCHRTKDLGIIVQLNLRSGLHYMQIASNVNACAKLI